MFHVSERSESTEKKEYILNLVLTRNVSHRHKESCIYFSIEKQPFDFFKSFSIFICSFLIIFAIGASSVTIATFGLLTCATFVVSFSSTVRKESVHLFVPIGLQVNAYFLLGNKSSIFIPWSSIRDFVITEVITRQTVIYRLLVLVDEDSVNTSYVCLFENTNPRLIILERVYKDLQTILSQRRKTK